MYLHRLFLNQELLNITLEISRFFRYLEYSISTSQQEIFYVKTNKCSYSYQMIFCPGYKKTVL